jgi:hypothetical protein
MPLPKVSHPLFDVTIPSTNKQIKIRPMLVKEEKILLIAKSSNDPRDSLAAVKQVVNNCIIDDKINIDNLTTFDIEYLFVKIRAYSISNVSKVAYIDSEDGETYDFEVDLDQVVVKFPEDIDKKIKVNDDITVVMKYASSELMTNKDFTQTDINKYFDMLIAYCVDKIYEGDEEFDLKDVSKEELQKYLEEEFDPVSYDKMRKFVINMPRLHYEINYTNSKGTERKILMTSLVDFFTFA